MTDEKLRALEEMCAGATAGPWIPKYVKVIYTHGEVEHEVRSKETGVVVASLRFRPTRDLGDDEADRDCAFIAAARTAVPALVAEVRRLREAARRG